MEKITKPPESDQLFSCKGSASLLGHGSFLISKTHHPLSSVLLTVVYKLWFSVSPPHLNPFFVPLFWLHNLAVSVTQLHALRNKLSSFKW